MKRQVATLCLILLLFGLAFGAESVPMFTGPTVSDISGLVAKKAFAKTIFLSAISPENCPLTFAVASGPTHGTITQLNAATGALIYTGTAGYTGTDSFTYHATAFTTGSCTTGSVTSSNATVSLTVNDTRTTINGQLLAADGITPRVGKVQWRLLQPASTFDGAFVTPGSVVERTLDGSGNYTVSLYSTDGMSPQTFWQLTFVSGATQEPLGLYRITGGSTLNQAALNALRETSAQNAAPVSIATTTQVEALIASVAGSAAAAASSAADAATSAAAAVSAAATAHNYDLVVFNPGFTTPTQVIAVIPANRSFTLALTGSTCSALAAATAQTDFLVQYSTNSGSSWTTKATLRFAAAAKTCTVVGASSTSVSTGDWVQILGPGTPDVTLANISFNVKGNLP